MASLRGTIRRANVIGAGPNGLAAAVTLAQAGLAVEVFEAEAQAGGAARTMELTLPGFHHDFGSSVYPMGAGSPFFRTLPLAELGLEWVHGDACAAHPLADGTAVMLERTPKDQARELGEDGRAWNELMRPAAERWWDFAADALQPPLHIPAHPILMARFGLQRGATSGHAWCGASAMSVPGRCSQGSRRTRCFALDRPMSAAVGLIFGATALAVGWPVAKGGAQAIPNALIRRLEQFGGVVHTSRRIRSLDELDTRGAITMCDVTARQLLTIAGPRLTPAYRRALQRFRSGPGAFKIDYALSGPDSVEGGCMPPRHDRACGRHISRDR